jgi:hypothetical protein
MTIFCPGMRTSLRILRNWNNIITCGSESCTRRIPSHWREFKLKKFLLPSLSWPPTDQLSCVDAEVPECCCPASVHCYPKHPTMVAAGLTLLLRRTWGRQKSVSADARGDGLPGNTGGSLWFDPPPEIGWVRRSIGWNRLLSSKEFVVFWRIRGSAS